MTIPTCAKCGMPMNPSNAKTRPELFLHDACLPSELLQQNPKPVKTLTRQVEEIIDKKIRLAGLAKDILATLQVNIERGYIVAVNDEVKLNLANIVARWNKALVEIESES